MASPFDNWLKNQGQSPTAVAEPGSFDEWLSVSKVQATPPAPEPESVEPTSFNEWLKLGNRADTLTVGEKAKEVGKAALRMPEYVAANVGDVIGWVAERGLRGIAPIPKGVPTVPELLAKLLPADWQDMGEKFQQKAVRFANNISDYWRKAAAAGIEAKDPRIEELSWLEAPILKGLTSGIESSGSFLTSVAAGAITKNPTVGLAILSAASGAGTYRELKEKGVGDELANATAFIAGAFEGASEQVPFNAIFKSGSKTFLRKFLKSASTEALQEFFQNMGENYLKHFATEYTETGKPSDALLISWAQLFENWQDAISGGLVMGGAGAMMTGRAGLEGQEPRAAAPPMSEAEQGSILSTLTRTVVKKRKIDVAGLDMPELSSAQTEEQVAAEEIVGRLGKKVIWFKDPNRILGIDGAVVSELPGVVFLDADGGRSVDTAMSHEITHHIRNDAPDVYRLLRDAVIKSTGNYEAFKAKKLKQGYLPLQVEEEFVAEMFSQVAAQPGFWEQAFAEEPGLIDKFLQIIRDVLEKLTGRGQREVELDPFLAQFIEDFNAVEKAASAAAKKYAPVAKGQAEIRAVRRQAIMKQQAGETLTPTEEKAVQYSEADLRDMGVKFSQRESVNKRVHKIASEAEGQFADHVWTFLSKLGYEEGLSDNTVAAYLTAVRDFSRFFKKRNIQTVRPSDLRAYKIEMSQAGKSASTVNLRMVGLNEFFGFLAQTGKIAGNPMMALDDVLIIGPKTLPRVLSPRQMGRFVRAVKEKTRRNLLERNVAMAELLWATGARSTEITDIKVSDLRLPDRLIVLRGKGGKQRMVPLTTTSAKAIQAHLDRAGLQRNDYLFQTRNGDQLTRQDIGRFVRQYAKKAGLPSWVHPHTLRHTFATQLLEGGADIRFIQEMMGHSTPEITALYAHVTAAQKKAAFKKYHPSEVGVLSDEAKQKAKAKAKAVAAAPGPQTQQIVVDALKKTYTNIPVGWHHFNSLQDWGEKGLRTPGNVAVGGHKGRKTFIWQHELERLPTRLPVQTLNAIKSRTNEVWRVDSRRGESYWLAPPEVVAEVKAELGEAAFEQQAKRERSPRQQLNDFVLAMKVQEKNGRLAGYEIGKNILSMARKLDIKVKTLPDEHRAYIKEFREYEQASRGVSEGLAETVEHEVSDAEERKAIQEEADFDSELGDFLDGIRFAKEEEPKRRATTRKYVITKEGKLKRQPTVRQAAQREVARETGMEVEAKVVTEEAALKATMRAQKKAADMGYRAGMAMGKAKAQELKNKYKTLAEWKKEFRKYVKAALPPAVQGKMMVALENIKGEKSYEKALKKLIAEIEKQQSREARTRLIKVVKKINKKWGRKGTFGGYKLLPEYEKILNDLMGWFTTKREPTAEQQADLNELLQWAIDEQEALEAKGLTDTPLHKFEAVATVRKLQNEQGRISVAEWPAEKIEQITEALQLIVYQHLFEREAFNRATKERLEADIVQGTADVAAAVGKRAVPTQRVGAKVDGLGAKLGAEAKAWLGRRNYNLSTLSKVMSGMKKTGPVWRRLAGNLEQGLGRSLRHRQQVMDLIWRRMAEKDISARDLMGMSNILSRTKWKGLGWLKKLADMDLDMEQKNVRYVPTQTISVRLESGKDLEVSIGQALDIYMHTRNPDNYKALTGKGGVSFHGQPVAEGSVFTGEDVDAITAALFEAAPKVRAVIEIMEEALAYQQNELNEVSRRLIGYDIATLPGYWHIRRLMPKTLGGKKAAYTYETIEGRSHLKERVGGTHPLIIGDAFSNMIETIGVGADYIGLAEPMRNAKTMLADEGFVKVAQENGFGEYLNDIRHQIARIENPGTDKIWHDKWIAGWTRNVTRAIFAHNVKIAAQQEISVFLAFAHLPFKYATSLRPGITKDVVARIEGSDSYLRDRFGGHISREIGDVAETGGALRFWTGKDQYANWGTWLIRHFDKRAIVNIWRMVEAEIADRAEFGHLTRKEMYNNGAYQGAVVARVDQIIRDTQPTWHKVDRSIIGSDPSTAARMLTMFHSQREKMVQMIGQANAEYRNSDKGAQAKRNLARTYGMVALNLALVNAWKVAFGVLVLRREDEPEEFFTNMLADIPGMFYILGPPIRESVKAASRAYRGKRAYQVGAISMPPLKVLESGKAASFAWAQVASELIDGHNVEKELIEAVDKTWDFSQYAFGLPFKSTTDIMKAWSD